MSLTSFSFIPFFAAVIIVMALLQVFRKKYLVTNNAQLLLLLVSSLLFICISDWRFCICIVFVISLTYVFGIWVERTHSTKILTGGVQH